MFLVFQRFIEDANNESMDEAEGYNMNHQRASGDHYGLHNSSNSDELHGRHYQYLRPEEEINRNNKIIENLTAMQNENQPSNIEKMLQYNQDNHILGLLLTNYLNENPELRNSIMRETGNIEDSELFQRMVQQLLLNDRRNNNYAASNMSADKQIENNLFIKEKIASLFQSNQRNNMSFPNFKNIE